MNNVGHRRHLCYSKQNPNKNIGKQNFTTLSLPVLLLIAKSSSVSLSLQKFLLEIRTDASYYFVGLVYVT